MLNLSGRAVTAAIALACVVCAPAAAAPGDLDPTFSGDGKEVTDLGGADTAAGVALQADGKVLVAGTFSGGTAATNNVAVVRYTTTGAPDLSFSLDGKANAFSGNANAFGVAIQPDGRIVVAGLSANDFALARFDAAGTLDNSFSGDGLQTTDLGGFEEVASLALQPDGRRSSPARPSPAPVPPSTPISRSRATTPPGPWIRPSPATGRRRPPSRRPARTPISTSPPASSSRPTVPSSSWARRASATPAPASTPIRLRWRATTPPASSTRLSRATGSRRHRSSRVATATAGPTLRSRATGASWSPRRRTSALQRLKRFRRAPLRGPRGRTDADAHAVAVPISVGLPVAVAVALPVRHAVPVPAPDVHPDRDRNSPTPAPAPSGGDQLLGCQKSRVVLEDVIPTGKQVRLIGVADRAFANRPVKLVFLATGKVVASPTIGADGRFSATVPLPPKKQQRLQRSRYQARIDSARSQSLKLFRRIFVDTIEATGGQVAITGRVVGRSRRRRRTGGSCCAATSAARSSSL